MKCRIVIILFMLSSVWLVPGVMEGEMVNKDTLTVSSPVFNNNSVLPTKYTCDGNNVNPPLIIENIPAAAKSLALIVDDPDAPGGIWVHWVLWNIDPETKKIEENTVPNGAHQGMNDFRQTTYNGPCPPAGTHRYFFKLYALDKMLTLSPNATKNDLEKSMNGHIVEEAHIIGLYQRK